MRSNKPSRPRVPIWAWPFALVCFAIPVISLGGAIPAGLGVGAGFYCLAVSRESKRSTYRKLAHCGAAMALAWTLFLALAGGVAVLQSKMPEIFGGDPGRQARDRANPAQGFAIAGSGSAPQSAGSHPATRSSARNERGLDEATRYKIYAKATSLRDNIAQAEQREREFRAKGMGEVAARQVEHIRGMHEDRQEFIASFYDISREELDEIVARGDRGDWPRD
jgi:hypothetical protein